MRAVLLVLVESAAAYQLLPQLSNVGSRAVPVVAKLPASVVEIWDGRFVPFGTQMTGKGSENIKVVEERDVEALWKTMKQVYGNEDNALRGARQNPTIIHPLYTNADTVKSSKAALDEVFADEPNAKAEVLEVMLMNPAVLQCGQSLKIQPASEIKRFASGRQLLDNVPKEASLGLLGFVLLTGIINVILKDSTDPAMIDLLAVTKPVLGGVGAFFFLGAIGAAAKASADKAKA